jgi:predicted ester cyclase
VTITAIHIHQIEGNRIAALWEEFDMFGLRRQLGA